jgi:hypothetical protein
VISSLVNMGRSPLCREEDGADGRRICLYQDGVGRAENLTESAGKTLIGVADFGLLSQIIPAKHIRRASRQAFAAADASQRVNAFNGHNYPFIETLSVFQLKAMRTTIPARARKEGGLWPKARPLF